MPTASRSPGPSRPSPAWTISSRRGGTCWTRSWPARPGRRARTCASASPSPASGAAPTVAPPACAGTTAPAPPWRLAARFVLGADGLRSRVARSVGAPIVEHRGAGGGIQYAYYAGLPWNGIEFFVADRSLAGVFPTHGGEACIWVCCPSTDLLAVRRRADSRADAFTALLRSAAPALADRLGDATRTSDVTGMLRMPNQLRQAAGPGWALVGDAGYHRDAVTGYGITDAYRDAELVAVAIDAALRGDSDEATALAAYAYRRDRALRETFELTCALAAYPPVPEFVALQKRLSVAIETDAAALAALPVPGEHRLATV